MESTVIGNLHFVEDPSIQKYDQVQIAMELYLRLFPQESKQNYVLVKFLGAPDYFQDFKLFEITGIDHNATSHNSITFTNNSFLAPFNGQITLTNCLVQSVAGIDIPVLTNVYVSVPPEMYELLNIKSMDAVRNSFLTKYLQTPILANNDLIRQINGEVILCEPVNQGRVTANTNIYIIKHDQERQKEQKQMTIEEDDIQLSNYLSSSLNMDMEPMKSPEFSVLPLSNKIIMNNLPPIWAKEDHELFVFINTTDMFQLGFPVFNGDSVCLNYGNGKVIVKIFTIIEPNKTFTPGSVFVSPILSINLGLSQSSMVYLEPLNKTRDLQISNILPTAKSVTISRVASPITLDKTYQQHFFSGLKTSFHSCFKAIRKGDFVPVVIDSILSKTMFDLGETDDEMSVIPTGDPDSVAWFKINEISGDLESNAEDINGQFIIDPLKTRMILSGVDFIRLPPNKFHNWYDYLSLPPIFTYTGPNFDYGSVLRKILLTNINSKLNLKTIVLLNSMSRGLGKTTLVRSLSLELGINLIELDCIDFINPGTELKTIGLLTGQIDKLLSEKTASDESFNIIYLKHIENLCVEINENEQGSNVSTSLTLKMIGLLNEYLSRPNLVVIMSCNDVDKLNNNLRSIVKFQVTFNVPNEAERLDIFKFLISNEAKKNTGENYDLEEFQGPAFNGDYNKYPYGIREDVNFNNLALQSAGLTPRDLISIVKKAKTLAIKRISKLGSQSGNIGIEKLIKIGNGGIISLIPQDFNTAINDARNQYSDSIGAPRIPNVKWEDIGGLDLVKDEILDTIDMPMKHPELFNNGLKKRSGILFYGPPGTGKTLLAKAIATNFSLNFFSVKGPELLNMYIGESEANVRRVFQKARDAKPCVIFFDELDSVAPKRGNQGDSGGVMDRIVSQLLAELDGMSGGGNGEGVFVVGATNRPDLLDEALLRPGRFDKMLYLGISDTDDKQVKILQALTRKFKLDQDVDLNVIAKNCSFTFTGADFYALCSDSMLNAMTRIANEVDVRIKQFNENRKFQGLEEISTRWWFDNEATEADTDVVVRMVDFLKAQNELVPSVSAEELDHYLRIRENFEGSKEKKGVSGGSSGNGTTDQINGTIDHINGTNHINGTDQINGTDHINGTIDHTNGTVNIDL